MTNGDIPIDEVLWLEASTFRDWHIDLDDISKTVVFRPLRDGAATAQSVPSKVPQSMLPVCHAIAHTLKQAVGDSAVKSLAFPVGPLFFRGERIRPGRYALRLSPKVVQNLGELKLGQEASQLLLDESFRKGGLILVAGDTGSGKTTTAYATVKERLARYGGYCLTVESPVEKELEGFHGEGYCEQVDATNTGFKSEVASAMRKFPAETRSMFFFGEVLDEEAAAELARLIGRGHLVITTIHSATMEQAIEMLIAFAERGGETYARSLIGQNLRAVVHQKLENQRAMVRCLRVTQEVASIISDSSADLKTLATAIDQQRRQASNQLLGRAAFQSQMRP